MKITNEMIMAGVSCRGGWNARQLRLLGVKNKTKGWKRDVIGNEITESVYREFLALKNRHVSEARIVSIHEHRPKSIKRIPGTHLVWIDMQSVFNGDKVAEAVYLLWRERHPIDTEFQECSKLIANVVRERGALTPCEIAACIPGDSRYFSGYPSDIHSFCERLSQVLSGRNEVRYQVACCD